MCVRVCVCVRACVSVMCMYLCLCVCVCVRACSLEHYSRLNGTPSFALFVQRVLLNQCLILVLLVFSDLATSHISSSPGYALACNIVISTLL